MGKEKDGVKLQRGALLKFIDEEKGEANEGLFIGPEDNSDYIVVPLSARMFQKKVGESLHVRCMFQGDLVEFRSNILEVIDRPVTLWRISEPADVENYDLRDQKRIQCSLSASIESIDKGHFVTGIIQDISKSGARCNLQSTDADKRTFVVNEQVTLHCTFPGIPGEQTVLGNITDICKTEEALSIGIQFVESVWWVPPYH